jgi:tetraacyldisaccharide 4'-kinase
MRKRVAAHVVSVGNITVGGAGKTPLVEMYAKLWLGKGKRVAIVSRGYGKSRRFPQHSSLPPTVRPPQGVRVVSDGSGGIYLLPDEAGDEPLLLAKRVPAAIVLVSKNRYAACQFAARELGAEAIILDDAFQHLRLHRDEDIVAVDATNPFGNGYVVPRGTLREPPASLARATRVVLTKILPGNQTDDARRALAQVSSVASQVPVSLTRYVPTHLSVRLGEETTPLDHLKDKNVVAFCGVADPTFFERTVRRLGARIVRMRPFPDHYPYTPADVASIEKDAVQLRADAIVTTEKDMVRLPAGVSTARPLYAVAVEIRIDD